MTAQEQMKKMLDELMGTQRDGATSDADLKFTNDRVCKSYIMGLCPHDLFNNTMFSSKKMDLGSCNKYHSPALKADFELASKNRDYGYDVDQLEHLQSFINDCDRKINIAKKRLEDTQDESDKSEEAVAIQVMGEQIGQKLAKAEELGAEGNVEESMLLLSEVEELKTKKRESEDIYRSKLPTSSIQQQKLRVCEVCAAYLSLYDNDRRLADHFGGKLHMGFIKIRDRLAELTELIAKKREEREKERQLRREEREKEREQERRDQETKRRDQDRHSSSSSKDKDRSHNRRSRSRDRSRDRRRRRSRSRDRRRRSRSRSPSRKSRSPSRKSRSPPRKSRSTSRSRSTSKSRKSHSRSPRRKSRSTSRSRSQKSRSRSKSK